MGHVPRSAPPEQPVRIGVAGFGFWGTKLARNVDECPESALAVVCDPAEDRQQDVVDRYRDTDVVSSFDALLAREDVQAVMLATPAEDHFRQARAALFAGKHTFVEKPLALHTAECDELIALAGERGLILLTGHTFLYSPAVRMLSEIVASGELGQILYCSSQRLNLGAIRTDTSAMWDLAPHDIAILLHLFGGFPDAVSAQQFSLLGERREDIAMITMNFRSGPVGHVQVSRLDPRKVRELTIVGDRKMAVYDDTDAEMPIRIYDKGIAERPSADLHHADFARHNLEVRSGDIVAPIVGGREPLLLEIEYFVRAIVEGQDPVSSAQVGREVVAVLEAAERSAELGGEPVFSYEHYGGHGNP